MVTGHLWARGLLASVLVVCTTGAASSGFAQGDAPFYQITGSAPDSKMGAFVARVPDVDGDGADEFVTGSHRFDGPNGADSGRVQLFSGRTGRRIWTMEGTQSGALLGHNVWGINDVTGDGKGDVIVSAYRFSSNGSLQNGRAYMLSGADGSLVWQKDGEASADEFGYSLGSVPDLDGDNIDDVLIGAWNHDLPNFLGGKVYVYSGDDGTFIRAHTGFTRLDRMGAAVAGMGDLDNDGRGDYAIGARDAEVSPGVRPGQVYFVSGMTGTVYATITGAANADQFGWNVTKLDDVTGDGIDDLYVGAPDHDPMSMMNAGRGYVYNGATQAQLYTLDGQRQGDRFGRFAAGVPDTNFDGLGELCVGAWNHSGAAQNLGAAYLFEGKDGSLIRKYNGEKPLSQFGFGLCGLNDVNSDDRGDIAIGAFQYDLQTVTTSITVARGRVQVFVEETLTGSASTLSVGQGGTINFQLNGGLRHAGRTYQLLCTVNGFLPGFQPPGANLHLPLNPGSVFLLSFNIANSAILPNAFRVFDAQGRGNAGFVSVPPLLMGQGGAGINLRFAYYMVVRLDHSSNMWRVGLIP